MRVPDDNHETKTGVMQGLIHQRLKARLSLSETSSDSKAHPDDDSITAFAEGRLDEEQSTGMVSHFVNCAACLHLTAQIVRHQTAADEVEEETVPDTEPGPFRRFLDRMSPDLEPLGGNSVFAYQIKDEVVDNTPESDMSLTPQEENT